MPTDSVALLDMIAELIRWYEKRMARAFLDPDDAVWQRAAQLVEREREKLFHLEPKP